MSFSKPPPPPGPYQDMPHKIKSEKVEPLTSDSSSDEEESDLERRKRYLDEILGPKTKHVGCQTEGLGVHKGTSTCGNKEANGTAEGPKDVVVESGGEAGSASANATASGSASKANGAGGRTRKSNKEAFVPAAGVFSGRGWQMLQMWKDMSEKKKKPK